MQKFNYQTKSYETRFNTLYDEGLRKYFLKIYSLMSSGLAITAVSAFAFSSANVKTNMMFNIAPDGYLIGITGIGWMITFAPPWNLTLFCFWTR